MFWLSEKIELNIREIFITPIIVPNQHMIILKIWENKGENVLKKMYCLYQNELELNLHQMIAKKGPTK